MSLILGIDTGGTYTDGVILERSQRRIVAKAKALTTRNNLAIGITEMLQRLGQNMGSDIDPKEVDFVALSTTLATNAIVEGHGCKVGLVLIGFEEQQNLPTEDVAYLPGGHNIRGEETQEFDEELARKTLLAWKGQVEALAVSSFLSIRNPEHELQLLRIAQETLDIPVVCAHQLTRSLGMKERSVTAVLNARLLPIIAELIEAVKTVLKSIGVVAPIMIVKGDGSLMGETQARSRPIETILSGPAASIIGANFLAGQQDAMVLDMGGTTTDIAVLRDGKPRLNQEGARVGGWLTKVEAAEINTYGMGGDSHIQKDIHGRLAIGPARVRPICVMASEFPYLTDELKRIHLPRSNPLVIAQITDCYIQLKQDSSVVLTDQEKKIIALLEDGPHSIFYLAKEMDTGVNYLDFAHLTDTGIIGQISITPTDILHVTGDYRQWNSEASRIAMTLLAERFGMDSKSFCDWLKDRITAKLAYTCWQSLINSDGSALDLLEDPFFQRISEMQLFPKEGSLLSCSLKPTLPIVAVGAPVGAWMPRTAEKLHASLIVPEHSEVANACGAAAGRVMEIVKILITPGADCQGYLLYSTWERKYFESLEEAVDYAKAFAEEKARELATSNGVQNIEVEVEHRDVYADANGISNDVFIESHVEAVGFERQDWGDEVLM